MATFLFDKIIFGPIQSRRLGVSLGVNLLPVENKICSFDCIYCECGWNPKKEEAKGKMPSHEEVAEKLEKKLIDMANEGRKPDVITFAGNGEPTLHPKFDQVIDDTIALRDKHCPEAKIAVLSNSTTIQKKSTFDALLKIEDNILKLDAGIVETIQAIDQPCGIVDLPKLINNLSKFDGQCVIQTLFVRGEFDGKKIDNTTELEIGKLIEAYQQIKPKQIMIYSIARDTPAQNLEAVSKEELESIAKQINLATDIEVSVS